ncbi:hypothetical protein X975_16797, partial [Stegodyphus mimosarum]
MPDVNVTSKLHPDINTATAHEKYNKLMCTFKKIAEVASETLTFQFERHVEFFENILQLLKDRKELGIIILSDENTINQNFNAQHTGNIQSDDRNENTQQ